MELALPLILKFLTDVLKLIPDSPFIYLFVLSMVLVVLDTIYGLVR